MCTCSVSSLSAPLCLVVSCLDETELVMTNEDLKNSQGMFVLKIEGFSVHSNVDPLNKIHEHIIFKRSSKAEDYSADEARYNYCNNKIFYQFSNNIRKLRHPKWSEGCEVCPKMTIAG